MGTSFLYNRVNYNGIPCIQNVSISEGTTSVTYNFGYAVALNSRFSGIIAVRITEVPTNTALPINLNIPGLLPGALPLTEAGGTEVTGADLLPGIHLVFYDRFNGVLQLV